MGSALLSYCTEHPPIDHHLTVGRYPSSTGRLLDYDYAKSAKAHNGSSPSTPIGDKDDLPIERARLRSALYLVVATTLATVGYGWAVRYHVVCLQSTSVLSW